VFVLDRHRRLVPPGVAGELYVAGAGVARGYASQPTKTAERFVANPFDHAGERMYRTGDLVRWNPGGWLEFLGRVDNQIKIRGFRVEPGEAEQTLSVVPGIAQATVTVREDRPGDPRMVAYYVLDGSTPVDAAALRTEVASTLPSYLVPSAFVELNGMPLTPNGKLDRAALPAPEITTAPGREPDGPHERLLCDLYAEILGATRINVDDGFFDLGGHSLLATRLLSRIRTTLKVELSLRDLFENPTAAGLAKTISATAASSRPVLRRRTRGGVLL